MEAQGHDEPTGSAKITPAFNLPSKFILHTVGPIIPIEREPNHAEENLLASCYESCLELAAEKNLRSVAFCCISTGEFHFPNRRAAEIAIATVKKFLANHELEIIFNVEKQTTKELLAESLKDLSQTKSVDKITIKELTKNCGLTSPTFYNHFRDKYELMAWIYNQEVEASLKNFGNGDSLEDVICK